MMIDSGTAMIVIAILTIIAFLKGWAHERKNASDDNKLSSGDIQRLRALLRRLSEDESKGEAGASSSKKDT